MQLSAPPYILKPGTTYWMGNEVNYRQIGHCLLALVFGVLGAVWSRLVFVFQDRRTRTSACRGTSNLLTRSVSEFRSCPEGARHISPGNAPGCGTTGLARRYSRSFVKNLIHPIEGGWRTTGKMP